MKEPIDKLRKGYLEFRDKYFVNNKELYNDLSRIGQSPKILIVACCDSRVDPAIVMNCKPGDLFVVRNVANLIPPCEKDNGYHGTSAALEFGVCVLEVEHIIIFGHTMCGGIQSLFKEDDNNENNAGHDKGFAEKWMQLADDSCKIVKEKHPDLSVEAKADICTKYSLINSLNNLKTFPWITERVNSKKLAVHAWYFDITNGTIFEFNQASNSFGALDKTD